MNDDDIDRRVSVRRQESGLAYDGPERRQFDRRTGASNLESMSDADLIAAYQRTAGDISIPRTDAIAAEVARRNLKV